VAMATSTPENERRMAVQPSICSSKTKQIAKTSGLTVEEGAMYTTPAYVKSILKPLGMLTKLIILLSDGQLKSVESPLER